MGTSGRFCPDLPPSAFKVAIIANTLYFKGEWTTAFGATIALPQPINMIMDHPFFYAIEDDATGELLFIGILENPAPSAAG